jgi:hypothetical protein
MVLKVGIPVRTVEYILKDDPDPNAPTRFILRPLTSEEYSEFRAKSPLTIGQMVQIDEVTKAARDEGRELTAEEQTRIVEITQNDLKYALRAMKQMALVVRYGVLKIENLQDLNGNPVEISGAEFAGRADPDMMCELGLEILRITRLPEGAAKNS